MIYQLSFTNASENTFTETPTMTHTCTDTHIRAQSPVLQCLLRCCMCSYDEFGDLQDEVQKIMKKGKWKGPPLSTGFGIIG